MTKYYLQVLKDNITICLDTDVSYHHEYVVGDIITIHMYSNKGPKVSFGGGVEYNAEFTLDWNKAGGVRLSVVSCINKGYLADITKNIERQNKLKLIGI
jgi:hypothetical protein